MGVKLRTAIGRNDIKLYAFHCPGCKHSHTFDESWTFNGDMEKPTFSPSLLNWLPNDPYRCHLFIRDGKIEYLSDCSHELAGKIIDMEDVNA